MTRSDGVLSNKVGESKMTSCLPDSGNESLVVDHERPRSTSNVQGIKV